MPKPDQRPSSSAPKTLDHQQITTSNQTVNAFLGGPRLTWMNNVQVAENGLNSASSTARAEKQTVRHTPASSRGQAKKDRPANNARSKSNLSQSDTRHPKTTSTGVAASTTAARFALIPPEPTTLVTIGDINIANTSIEDSVLPSPALTNEPSPADTTRNASPNIAAGIPLSENQQAEIRDDALARAQTNSPRVASASAATVSNGPRWPSEHILIASPSVTTDSAVVSDQSEPPPGSGVTRTHPQTRPLSRQEEALGQDGGARKRIRARLEADASAQKSKRARHAAANRESPALTHQPDPGMSVGEWIQSLDSRVEICGGGNGVDAVGNDLDRLRYQYLRQACHIGDTFYVILHQILCLWTTNRPAAAKALPSIPGATMNRAMEMLQMILRSNQAMTAQHLNWFSTFPLSNFEQMGQLQHELSDFLVHFSAQWPGVMDAAPTSQSPLTARFLLGFLRCKSKTLQGTLFTVSRRTMDIPDEAAAPLNRLFAADQSNEERILLTNEAPNEAQASRDRINRDYHALVAQARAAHGRRPQAAAPPFGTNGAPSQQPQLNRPQHQATSPAQRTMPTQLAMPAQLAMPTQLAMPAQAYQSPVSADANGVRFTLAPSRPGQQDVTAQSIPPGLVLPSHGGQYGQYSAPGPSGSFNNGQHPHSAYQQDQAMMMFPSSSVPRFATSDELQSPSMWNQNAPFQNQNPVYHGGRMMPGNNRQMMASGPQHVPAGHQRYNIETQLPPHHSPYPSPTSYLPQGLPQGHIAQPTSSQSPAMEHQPMIAARRRQSAAPASTNASPATAQGHTPATSGAADHTTLSRRRGYIIPLNEYPRSPYDFTSFQSAAHLPQLRSPKRQPLGPAIPSSRHYQYLDSFAVKPTLFPPEVGLRHLEFSLSKEDMQRISRSVVFERNAAPTCNYFEGSRRYRLRLCMRPEKEEKVKDTTWAVSPTHWPREFYPSINDKPLQLPRKQHFHHDLPVELSEYVVEGKNVIKISFPRRARNFQMKMTFFIAVEVIVTRRHESVLTLVESFGHVSPAETKGKIAKRLEPSESDDLIVEDETLSISLADPFTSIMFTIPTRGLDCQHLECFDLDVWLMTRDGKPSAVKGQEPSLADSWNCPICGKDARPGSLRIDRFFVDVREELLRMGKRDTRRIQVAADGSWTAVVEPDESDDDLGEGVMNTAVGGPRLPPPTIVEVLDDD